MSHIFSHFANIGPMKSYSAFVDAFAVCTEKSSILIFQKCLIVVWCPLFEQLHLATRICDFHWTFLLFFLSFYCYFVIGRFHQSKNNLLEFGSIRTIAQFERKLLFLFDSLYQISSKVLCMHNLLQFKLCIELFSDCKFIGRRLSSLLMLSLSSFTFLYFSPASFLSSRLWTDLESPKHIGENRLTYDANTLNLHPIRYR